MSKKHDAQELQEKRLWATACHESGHALAFYILGLGIRRVSIVPGADFLGYAEHLSRLDLEFLARRPILGDRLTSAKIARWHDKVVGLFAGGEAERLLAAKGFRPGDLESDLEKVSEIIAKLHLENERPLVSKWLRLRAKNMVSDPTHRNMIIDGAKLLMKRREVTREEIILEFRGSFDRQTLPPDLLDGSKSLYNALARITTSRRKP
jgi:hypothetical protein